LQSGGAELNGLNYAVRGNSKVSKLFLLETWVSFLVSQISRVVQITGVWSGEQNLRTFQRNRQVRRQALGRARWQPDLSVGRRRRRWKVSVELGLWIQRRSIFFFSPVLWQYGTPNPVFFY
jgi:hypothetical protein